MPLVESFSIIVGLIGQFRSEKSSTDQLDYNDLMAWLTKSNHEEIRRSLQMNTNATIYIKALLNQDHELFKAEFKKIDSALASFASSIDGFAQLANVYSPSSVLSEQALDILRQFERSGASKIVAYEDWEGTSYAYSGGGTGSLNIRDERFVDDDFSTLIELGLLRQDYNNQGANVYVFTRAASDLVSKTDSLIK